MERTSPLTAEEYDAVRAAVLAGADGRSTLNSLLAGWCDLVADVKEGYGRSRPELSNDLWCRGALARVWPRLPERVRALRQPELDAYDDRFRAATVPWPDLAEGGRWWDRRIPRRLDVEAGEARWQGWPMGWDMMPFPKPDEVDVVE
ncbi:hypothetical protein AB0G67_12480 [Streptomyces sp. NPDC021056]|uniref:hypothetical protein n=1 Tax=Streptomyces sp. NPDC021056 TaxID=3155012 RepID=UPI0033F42E7D